MHTVNFQCGHCNNLMAVGTDYLGQQVRCPHCGQVVVAPSPQPAESPFTALSEAQAPAPAPTPETPLLRRDDHEDIFTPPVDDSLFGPSDGPRIEMPRRAPEPPPVPPTIAPVSANGEGHAPVPAPAVELPAQAPASGGLDLGGLTPLREAPSPGSGTRLDGQSEAPSFLPSTPATLARTRRDSGGFGSLIVILMVILPLILYSILATIAAGMLYIQKQTAPANPFDVYPDVTGDNPGVKKPQKTVGRLEISMKSATAPLPPGNIVQLGNTLIFGDLEITPKVVKREKVRVYDGRAANAPAEPTNFDALVLVLHLKNRSERWAFSPLDNYFDRKWKPGAGGSPPLTFLQAGNKRFFGGPCNWVPADSRDAHLRQWLAGPKEYPDSDRKNGDPDGLQPGQEMDTVVATDGDDKDTANYLFGNVEGAPAREPYKGKFLWRVQVRRGAYSYKGQDRSATGVIGVEFTDKDYKKDS